MFSYNCTPTSALWLYGVDTQNFTITLSCLFRLSPVFCAVNYLASLCARECCDLTVSPRIKSTNRAGNAETRKVFL
jgi:hypothetical protein